VTKSVRLSLACWPRLLDIHLAAAYASVGSRTVEDWIYSGLLISVKMPGTRLRDKQGNVIAHPQGRKIAKILIDKADLDKLIDERKTKV
jgi:hypothetical protein